MSLTEDLNRAISDPGMMTDAEVERKSREILMNHGITEAGTCDKQRLIELVRTIVKTEGKV